MDEIIKLMKERAETLRKGIAKAEKDVGTFVGDDGRIIGKNGVIIYEIDSD